MKIITLEKWEDYTRLIREEFSGNHWIFRGQSDQNWPLMCGLQRLYTRRIGEIEKELLRKYKNGISLHDQAKLPEDSLGLLAHMQHYGGPTRLLDFTESAYIAAFFAYESIPKFISFNDSDCIAIWILNSSWLKVETHNKLLNDNEFLSKLKERTNIDYEVYKTRRQALMDAGTEDQVKESERNFFVVLEEKIFKHFGDFFIDSTHKTGIIYPVKPSTLTRRFHIQQGVFLCSSCLDSDFMETLSGYNGNNDNIIKVLLPKSQRELALRDSYRTNITREHLFPGIDGFAQSILNSIQLPEEMNASRANTLLTE